MRRSASGYPAAWSAPWVMRRFFKAALRFTLTRVPIARPGSAFAEHAHEKREAGFPPPLWSPLQDSAGSSGPGGLHMVHRLLGRSFRHREYRNEGAAACFGTKLDFAFDLGEQGMVGAHADIKAGMPGGAALTRDDVTGNHVLAAVGLDAKALTGRITSVPRRTACFFVSHNPSPTNSSLRSIP